MKEWEWKEPGVFVCTVAEMRKKKSKIFCRTQVTVIGDGVLLFLVAKIIEAQVQHRKKI